MDGLTIRRTCNLEDDDSGEDDDLVDDPNHAGDDNGKCGCAFPVETKLKISKSKSFEKRPPRYFFFI